MSFDAHQLDSVLLVGAVVMLVAILAVRVSVRVGLPSLLIYLLMGVLLGEAGLGIQFEDAELAHALGFAALVLILAEGGLTTRWAEIRPAMRLGVSLATVGVGGQRAVMARRRALPARPRLAARGAAGGGHLADGRRRGVLGAAPGAAAAPADRGPGGGVGPQRRADRPAGHAGQHRCRARPRRARLRRASSSTSWPAAWLVGLADRVRRRLGDAPGGAAVLGPLPAGRAVAGGAGVRRHRVRCTRRASPRSTSAALVLGNSELPHRAATRSFAEGVAWLAQIGLFVMLGLLVSPGRISLGHRAMPALAGLLLTFVARPLSVLACSWCHRLSLRRAAVPVLGGAARRGARSCSPPSRWPSRCRGRASCSTSSS